MLPSTWLHSCSKGVEPLASTQELSDWSLDAELTMCVTARHSYTVRCYLEEPRMKKKCRYLAEPCSFQRMISVEELHLSLQELLRLATCNNLL